jgi:hypothetical protein
VTIMAFASGPGGLETPSTAAQPTMTLFSCVAVSDCSVRRYEIPRSRSNPKVPSVSGSTEVAMLSLKTYCTVHSAKYVPSWIGTPQSSVSWR